MKIVEIRFMSSNTTLGWSPVYDYNREDGSSFNPSDIFICHRALKRLFEIPTPYIDGKDIWISLHTDYGRNRAKILVTKVANNNVKFQANETRSIWRPNWLSSRIISILDKIKKDYVYMEIQYE